MPLEFPEAEPESQAPIESAQASHDTSFKLLAVYAIVALLALGEIYLLAKLSSLRGELEAQQSRNRAELMSAIKAQLDSNMERLQQANAQRVEAFKGEIDDAIKRAGAAGGELRQARAQVSRLEKQQHDQAEQFRQQIAQKADQQQLGSLHQDLSSQRTDLDDTKKALESVRSDLGMARSEFGTLIARNHDEVEQLRRMGDRDYFEFTLERKQPLRVANIGLTLTKTNVKHHRFNLNMVVDDTEVERKNRTINEPIFFYARGSKKPFELVVNDVESSRIKGYISTPKGAVQAAASSGAAR